MTIKRVRHVVGLVAAVEFDCGCRAVVAQGEALTLGGVKHTTYHVCSQWKRHKYELADAERDLARRLHKHRKTVYSANT